MLGIGRGLFEFGEQTTTEVPDLDLDRERATR
jgi:hypothetical protein